MNNDSRLHWIDLLRDIFILLMVAYHFVFDLHYFDFVPYDLPSGLWVTLAHVIQFGFFGLVGFSLHLSYRRSDYLPFLKRQARRAGLVFLVAMAITALTYLILPGGTIWFGALHFIAVSILIGALLIRHPLFLILILLPTALLGFWFPTIEVAHNWLLPLGIISIHYGSFDYFPLFPWLAVIFSGMLIARWMDRLRLLKNPQRFPRIHSLEILGRNSLLIYVLHQPILFGLLWLLRNI